MINFAEIITKNNQNHEVDNLELDNLIKEANKVYLSNFDDKVWFERSVFINWTCAIADCKYCYLSTKPKYNPQDEKKALRSVESILAEVLVCKLMKWDIGYITGGLRVESVDYLVELVDKINLILTKKIMMNFGPYSENIIKKFSNHVSGMGSAIESFNEDLHNFICPSKPLKSLMKFLGCLDDLNMEKLITIILGMGERKEDVNLVIENVKKFGIDKVQLCFLKPQEGTIFSSVPSPDPKYMAWWIAKLRIACPKLIIKIALVKERISDVSLYLEAGANCFSRFMIFNDFSSKYALDLVKGCEKAERELEGEFLKLPTIDLKKKVMALPFDDNLKKKILVKAEQYWKKLEKMENTSIL